MTTDTRPGVQVTHMVIGGESVDAADGQTFDVIDPATGNVIATVPLGGREDVDRAVAAAQKAFEDRKGWATWAAGKRGRSLAKLAALIKEHTEELSQLESRNVGKPISGARGEVTTSWNRRELWSGPGCRSRRGRKSSWHTGRA